MDVGLQGLHTGFVLPDKATHHTRVITSWDFCHSHTFTPHGKSEEMPHVSCFMYLIIPDLNQMVVGPRYKVGLVSSAIVINRVHPLMVAL